MRKLHAGKMHEDKVHENKLAANELPARKPASKRVKALAAALVVLVGLVGLALASTCTHFDRHTAVDLAMGSAYRPAPLLNVAHVGPTALAADNQFQILAGDFHCHVSPPDWDQEANRDLNATVLLAKREHLDFVVLTPHVGARFFLHDDYRQEELADLAGLRDEIARQGAGAPLLIAGFEYTDHRHGHLGFSFGDLDQLLARHPSEQLAEHPEDFVSAWVASGGLVVLNHPLVTPLDSAFAIGRVNLSWRPWTAAGPFPPEIAAANRLAQGIEAYNLTAAHLRDRYLSHPGPGTYEETLTRIDREILGQERRLVPLGGSDSHEDHLRATSFVLATARTVEAIRDAVLAGRAGCACVIRALVHCGPARRSPTGSRSARPFSTRPSWRSAPPANASACWSTGNCGRSRARVRSPRFTSTQAPARSSAPRSTAAPRRRSTRTAPLPCARGRGRGPLR